MSPEWIDELDEFLMSDDSPDNCLQISEFDGLLMTISPREDLRATVATECYVLHKFRWAESLLVARTYRQSHLLNMSGVSPTPDLRVRMSGIMSFSSGLPSGSDLTDTPAERLN